MRFERHRNGMRDCWYAYGDGDDPITQVTGVGGYTGEIYPCNGDVHPRPFCAGPDGKECGKLHGHTATTQLPNHPEADTFGHETRSAAAEALTNIRRVWANEIKEKNA